MSRSNRINRLVRALIIEFIETQRPKGVRNDKLGELESPSALDVPFKDYWRRLHREHQACVACAQHTDHEYEDALSTLRPDPITGVSSPLRDYILTYGSFDSVTNRGTILLGR